MKSWVLIHWLDLSASQWNNNNPFQSGWKGSLFENFDKIHFTGNFGAPILHSNVPPGKAIVRCCTSFRVNDGDTAQAYDLSTYTCAYDSSMQEGIDFSASYSPVGSIDGIRLTVALAL